MPKLIKNLPKPPYWTVIFTATLIERAGDDFYELDAKLDALVQDQPGFLGSESFLKNKKTITISYWQSLADIQRWKNNELHLRAQELGTQKWYQYYSVKIAKVEKAYDFSSDL